jgi:hypothetical protein
MADVASKQQAAALFLSAIVTHTHTHTQTHTHTHTRRHTELTKETDKTDGKPVLYQRTFSSGFPAVFVQFNLKCVVTLRFVFQVSVNSYPLKTHISYPRDREFVSVFGWNLRHFTY